jgi:hypothetical protein
VPRVLGELVHRWPEHALLCNVRICRCAGCSTEREPQWQRLEEGRHLYRVPKEQIVVPEIEVDESPDAWS